MSNSTVDELLNEWAVTKEQILVMEKKIEKLKKVASRIMLQNNVSELCGSKYKLKRRRQERFSISKDSVPEEIWDRYKRNSRYDVFTISQFKK